MRKWIRGIAFAVIVTALLVLAGWVFRPAVTDVSFRSLKAFHQLEPNAAEVLVLGSSRAWRNIDMMELYREYGIAGYNYGSNWQHINTTLLFLKDALKTQSPKLLMIETYNVNSLLKNKKMNGEIYYTRGLPWSMDKLRFLKDCFGTHLDRYFGYLLPVYQFHNNWTQTTLEDLKPGYGPDIEDFVDHMGYVGHPAVYPCEIGDYRDFPQEELGEDAVTVLDEILRICGERDIRVFFFTAPYPGEYAYYDAVQRYADAHGCLYLNGFAVLDEIGIDPQTDFNDPKHMNWRGAVKMANYLGSYLTQHYDLTDFRQIPGNLWEQAQQRLDEKEEREAAERAGRDEKDGDELRAERTTDPADAEL